MYKDRTDRNGRHHDDDGHRRHKHCNRLYDAKSLHWCNFKCYGYPYGFTLYRCPDDYGRFDDYVYYNYL
jgi:hypothetical protein